MATKDVLDDFVQLVTRQLNQFLATNVPDCYAVGFFCDAFSGSVLLARIRRNFTAKTFDPFRGIINEERFRWEMGNWKYLAGLFPSSSPEQKAYEKAWADIRSRIRVVSQESLSGCVTKFYLVFK